MIASSVLALTIVVLCAPVSGRVLELDDRFAEVQNHGSWLVMFYAPWCGHCKHMEPTWLDVGKQLLEIESDVQVGKVDAVKYSSLASQHHIRGFPTVKFFKDGDVFEYNGARTTKNIVSYVTRLSGPPVSSVENVDHFYNLKKSDGVSFLCIGPDDEDIRSNFNAVAKILYSSLSFYSADRYAIPHNLRIRKIPTIIVFKDGNFHEFVSESIDKDSIKDWVLSEQLPSYIQLDGSSYQTMKTIGKRIAIAVLNEHDEFSDAVKEIAVNRDEPFTFCWVIGEDIINSLTYGTIAVPNVVIFDPTTYEYIAMIDGADRRTPFATKTNIYKFFSDVEKDLIPPKGGNGFWEKTKRTIAHVISGGINFFMEAPVFASAIILLPTFVIIMLCICLCTISDTEESSFTDDEDEDYEDGEDNDLPPEYYDEPPPDSQEMVDSPQDEVESHEIEGLRQRISVKHPDDADDDVDDTT